MLCLIRLARLIPIWLYRDAGSTDRQEAVRRTGLERPSARLSSLERQVIADQDSLWLNRIFHGPGFKASVELVNLTGHALNRDHEGVWLHVRWIFFSPSTVCAA